MKTTFNKKKAFTLIELLIVIAIIGILFIVLVSKVDFATDKAKATGVQTDFRSFQMAFDTVAREQSGFSELVDDNYDKLEVAINKNLDAKLHIDIDDATGEINMLNGALDPWGVEYHGKYLQGDDGKDRGAIVIYSNGANLTFGSEATIVGGVVTISANNDDGKDDYSIVSCYSYMNGYGEIFNTTTGFGNNQSTQGNISNNSGTEGTEGTDDPDVTELLEPGLYQAGAIELAKSGNIESAQDMLKTSWSELEASGAIAISEGENIVLPEINEYGFYYGVPYSISDNTGCLASLIFNEDRTAALSNSDGVFPLPAEAIIYGNHYIDLSACGFPCLTVSADGTSLDDGYGSIFYIGSGILPKGTVYLSEANGEWPMFDGDLVLPAGRAMIIPEDLFCNQEFLTGIVIPDSVTSIGTGAFSCCSSLTSITIPDGVTSIGDWVFWGCFSLEDITVDNNNTAYMSIDGNLYTKDGKTLIHYAIGKTDTIFTIPDSVTEIGDNAFNGCRSLTTITIPDSVTSIGTKAFYDCNRLTSVVIPDSVTSIGSSAFALCTSLTSIVIGDSVTNIGEEAFWSCLNLVEVINKSSLNITAGSPDYEFVANYAKVVHNGDELILVKNVDNYLFMTYDGINYLLGYMGTNTELILPEKYNGENYEIYDYAFLNQAFSSFVIPDSVTSIGTEAFGNCYNLTSVIITDGITNIGRYAFAGCGSLTSVVMCDSVTSIGDCAFYNCPRLTSIIFKGSVEQWSYISKNSSWNFLSPAPYVQCTDGQVTLK